jgi:hypothetical protein
MKENITRCRKRFQRFKGAILEAVKAEEVCVSGPSDG